VIRKPSNPRPRYIGFPCRLLIASIALVLWGEAPSAHGQRPALDQAVDTTEGWQGEAEILRVGMALPVHGLDSTLGGGNLASWIERAIGSRAEIQWEVNDCGEASGSPTDSARDLPVCIEARVVLSGGREMYVSVAVGTQELGVIEPAELWGAAVDGPDTSAYFYRLSDLERYLVRERPVLGDTKVYLDERRNVHIVTSANKDVRLTRDGRYRDPKLSPDQRSVGMLVTSMVHRGYGQTYEPIEVAQELCIYRGGRVIRRFEPGGFIRAWNFANEGKAVAVYSGALRTAGFYVLYDFETWTVIEWARDPVTERSPQWVRGISP